MFSNFLKRGLKLTMNVVAWDAFILNREDSFEIGNVDLLLILIFLLRSTKR